MSNFTLTIHWHLDTPVHFGTGLSQAGLADRTIRLNPETQSPEFPGDAFKGAVRGMSERLVRWLDDRAINEEKDHSLPAHPALRRLFVPNPPSPTYRFSTPSFQNGGESTTISSTKINRDSGVAENQTLRITQSWTAGAGFKATIHGFNGDWANPESHDFLDLVLLYASLVSTDTAGGRKSSGHGHLEIVDITIDGIPKSDVLSPSNLTKLQGRLRQEPVHG